MPPVSTNPLPIIDIAPFLTDAPNVASLRASTAAALHAACIEYGFFYLDISAYVDPSIPAHLAELAQAFFHLPQAEKDTIGLKNSDGARGYARLKENVTNGKGDNHEGVDFYRPVEKPDKMRLLHGENQWPTQIPGFREAYEAWVEKMKVLGMVVMRAMAQGLGMTSDEWNELRAKVDNSFWAMRIIGYPPLPNDDDSFSCGAHKDYGCLTFLYADPTPRALQVFSSRPKAIAAALADPNLAAQVQVDTGAGAGAERGVWINADPVPGCVVCNIGEMWEVWTNGLYRSTLHQVVHRSSRYSIPFFFEPNFDAEIRPLGAALRLQNMNMSADADADAQDRSERQTRMGSVVYGEFLMKKVGNNFGGKGKYD